MVGIKTGLSTILYQLSTKNGRGEQPSNASGARQGRAVEAVYLCFALQKKGYSV